MKELVLALSIPLQPLVSDSVLEPSVRNEVDHALSRAPSNVVSAASLPVPGLRSRPSSTNCCAKAGVDLKGDVFGTNQLSATEIAIKLVSCQKSDGRWLIGTNDVTHIAVKILKSL